MRRAIAIRLVLSAVVLALVAVCVAPAFADSRSHPGFEHGSLRIERSGSGPMFSPARLATENEQSASVKVSNAGSLSGLFWLSVHVNGSDVLLRHLHLTVARQGATRAETLYAGSLYSLHRLALGGFGPVETCRYRFRLTLPSTGSNVGDNALQGLSASATFAWTASQAA